MQGRFGFRRISSIFIMLSAISFRGPISSSNILLYSILPIVPSIFGQSCRMCSWVSSLFLQNLHRRFVSWIFL